MIAQRSHPSAMSACFHLIATDCRDRRDRTFSISAIVAIVSRRSLPSACIYIQSKYKKVGVLPIRIAWSNVSSIGPSSERNRKIIFLFLSDEGPMLETLDHTIRIGSTPTFLYFDLYLYSANAAHYVYIYNRSDRYKFFLSDRSDCMDTRL